MTGLIFLIALLASVIAGLEWQHQRWLHSGAVPDRPRAGNQARSKPSTEFTHPS